MSRKIYSKIEALRGLIQSQAHAVPIKVRFKTATENYVLFVEDVAINNGHVVAEVENHNGRAVQIPLADIEEVAAFTDALNVPVFLDRGMTEPTENSSIVEAQEEREIIVRLGLKLQHVYAPIRLTRSEKAKPALRKRTDSLLTRRSKRDELWNVVRNLEFRRVA